MSSTLNIAFAQINSTDNIDQNFKLFFEMLEIAPSHSELLCFPENTFYFRLSRQSEMKALDLNDDRVKAISTWCSKNKKAILVGGTPTLVDGKTHNATLFFEPQKSVEVVYSKLHLFDVDVSGEKPVRESDDFAHGSEAKIIEYKGFKLGLSICYDLRFSELFLNYSLLGADIILVPAAFLPTTGEAHWQPLLQARAIESQCYVVAAAQAGVHKSESGAERQTHGHSLAIGPWGEILVDLEKSQNSWGELKVETSAIKKVQEQIPMKSHRRQWLLEALSKIDPL